jgi:hypothetical protein
MVYSYALATPGNISVIALKIEKQLSAPSGMSLSGGRVDVTFAAPLTSPQKTTLDTIMADASVGAIPSNGANTIFSIEDALDGRVAFKAAIGGGFTVDLYPDTEPSSKTFLHFNKVLTNAEKNALRAAFAALLKQVQ